MGVASVKGTGAENLPRYNIRLQRSQGPDSATVEGKAAGDGSDRAALTRARAAPGVVPEAALGAVMRHRASSGL